MIMLNHRLQLLQEHDVVVEEREKVQAGPYPSYHKARGRVYCGVGMYATIQLDK